MLELSMEQPNARSSHVVVDIAGAAPICCAVCMEPMEWVAIGHCGHRSVCVDCTARIRFVDGHRQCCICRTHCPTVLVTKAEKAGPQAFFRPPPSSGREGRVDANYWYHDGMAAYFDDRHKYKAMSKMCVKPSRPANNENNGGGTVDFGALSQEERGNINLNGYNAPLSRLDRCILIVAFLLVYSGVIMMMGIISALLFTLAKPRFLKAVIVLAFGLLSAAFTSFIYFAWHKSIKSPREMHD
ncbi:hypothetical protein ACP70R_006724 [Stipagrostis hirtigluma subsp. patula]